MQGDFLDTAGRLGRIERMIEQYRYARQRRLVRQAMRLWRQAAMARQLSRLDAPPQRIH